MNSRSFRGSGRRKETRSRDGGETWSPLMDVEGLVELSVMASVLVVGDENDERVLYAGPWSTNKRENGAVLESRDGGRSWGHPRVLYSGRYAYSVLTRIDEETIGCLFERDGTDFISLVRFRWK